MPFKHQAASYRTRRGKRFENDGDICDLSLGDLAGQARARVLELRAQGRNAFSERQPDGFFRVFVATEAV